MDEMIYEYIVVRYGELSTKGKNRKDFIKCLVKNIKNALIDYPNLKYNAMHDGLFIYLNGEDYNGIKKKLKKVFGHSYFAGAIKTGREIEDIAATALKIAENHPYKTFKVQAKRNDKSYPIHSDAINRAVASHILKNTDLKVDVHNPELMIYIVVKNDGAYIMDQKINGIGGYPVGVNSRAMLMLSGGIDSPVAAFLTMKRGLKIECIHFASMPYTSKQALDKVYDLAHRLSEYQNDIIVHVIPFTDLQLAIYEHVDESYAVTIMRRMMYRIADTLCKKRNINVISNGESLGQVASQTPESMTVISSVCDTLILRPVCMMDKLEIIAIAKKLDTYETSILPYEDCCTIFTPKNPVTHPKKDKCEYYESLFDYQKFIDECVNNDEIVKIEFKTREDKFEDIF